MTDDRQAIERQGDLPLEHAIALMLRKGDLGRHAHKARRIYQARRDLLVGLLRQDLGEYLGFSIPAGGLVLWTQIKPGLDAERWSQAAGRLGLAVAQGLAYFLDVDATSQAFRLGFANLDDDDLRRPCRVPEVCATQSFLKLSFPPGRQEGCSGGQHWPSTWRPDHPGQPAGTPRKSRLTNFADNGLF